ncbi:MAG: hypothetical protein J5582_05330 [Ruminococcus sp.]|uniref:hypothetical protein n=1 Tax=Ruminococcus sp. TaxID=41978 RepID=UPI0025E315D1|nr:hypothetical protein [Ruminococcus sp.]MBO4865977.1 hypothetical protein [Ruminococcus sp.]
MRKHLFIISLIITTIVVFSSCVRKNTNTNDVITLSKEPNYIFSSEQNNALYIVSDNKLQQYIDGVYKDEIDITNGIRNAYVEENKVYFIDDDNNYTLLNLNDNSTKVLISNVIDYSMDKDSIAVVTKDKLLYIYSKNDINNFNKIENIENVKSVKIHNDYLLAIDNNGNLYEISHLDSQPSIKEIKEIKGVDSVYCGYGNMALTVDGNYYYWFKDYYSNSVDPYVDSPSEIIKELSLHNISEFTFGSSICIGWEKGGSLYYWGISGESDKVKGIEYVRSPKAIKGFSNVESVYIGKSIIYVKNGLNITTYSFEK